MLHKKNKSSQCSSIDCCEQQSVAPAASPHLHLLKTQEQQHRAMQNMGHDKM